MNHALLLYTIWQQDAFALELEAARRAESRRRAGNGAEQRTRRRKLTAAIASSLQRVRRQASRTNGQVLGEALR